jgi:hypothetical protein
MSFKAQFNKSELKVFNLIVVFLACPVMHRSEFQPIS